MVATPGMSSENGAQRVSNWLWLLLLALATLGVYAVGFRVGYYFDTLNLIYEAPHDRPFYYFTNPNPLVPYGYRPVADTIMSAIQRTWGLNPLPVHIVVFSGHALLCWFLFWALCRIGAPRRLAMLASVFMLVSQIHTGVLLKVDMLNQVLGLLFGLGALLCIWYRGASTYLVGLLLFALALFAKETSLGYLPMVGVVILVRNLKSGERSNAWYRTLLELAPFVAVTVFYMVVRSNVVITPAKLGDVPYSLTLGLRNVINVALYTYAALTPVSTVDTYVALRTGAFGIVAVAAGFTLLWVLGVSYGVLRSEHKRFALLFLLMGFFGMFPAVLMNWVSEQFVYNSMPFIAVFLAVGLERLLREQGAWRTVAISLAVLVLVSHTVSIQAKGTRMAEMQRLGDKLHTGIVAAARDLPPNGSIWLVRPREEPVSYSHYAIPSYMLVVPHYLAKIMSRKDVALEFLTEDEFRVRPKKPNVVVFRVDRRGLTRLSP